ncbi:universal stress protein [Aureimonas leprariae]|uniref:Universal stress protein n=1 Tax=Plantimonas leprariae TaxID=2615207 RepID=A0A7V7PQ20_9HYPH|nr:universal stress protein [Aureimonas leprariae]KAB0680228.1 universal stress protein [Aureimonas leprariae]
MRTLLVPVEPSIHAERILELAGLVAGAFGSLIEGFPLRSFGMSAIGWDPESLITVDPTHWNESQTAAEAKAKFVAFMRAKGIAEDGPGPGEAARWRWAHDRPEGDGFLGSYGRGFDLTVVGQPGSEPGASTISTLESALFESGGPILIAPPRPVAQFGETVAIAWNGSTETARTIAFAMPFLQRARRVLLLADDGALGHAPSGEAIRLRLVRNGVPADLKLLPEARIRSGEAILREAESAGCDLLVKGAYTQSRIRQMIFGGATQHILAKARMPVLMAH